MEALYILVPLSIVVVFIAIWAFFRMSDSGQFDDMEGPALRILQDDDRPQASPAHERRMGDLPSTESAKRQSR